MLIKSVFYTDTEVLQNIRHLYLDNGDFELDPCYSKGNFYKTISGPLLKYDLFPQDNETRHVLDQIVIEDGIKETRQQFKLV